MVTAKIWHEEHDNYKKYGLDMRPKAPRVVKAKKSEVLSAKDRVRLVVFAIIVGVLGICIIISTAYAATLKYEINSMLAQNTEIKREIETLNVQIKTSANIATVEERAISELGMVYPSPANIVYLSTKEKPASNFAMILKEQAYN